ncbi:hypothetical protein ACFXOY_09260 [Streptomyces niveus]|uniref:hypothetical protein n=1 Tax=Streptomyces niveus TaxID=193462 RepID=UPI0036908B44
MSAPRTPPAYGKAADPPPSDRGVLAVVPADTGVPPQLAFGHHVVGAAAPDTHTPPVNS